jgi:hypothetical protein
METSSPRWPEMKNAMGNHPPEARRKDGSDNPQPAKPLENDKIRRLRARSNLPLYEMALFIALSIGAIRDFDFLPSFPPGILAFLGEGPSAGMISTALLIYSFSAIILILSRMMSGSGKYGGFTQLGYLSGFYLFYHFSGAMEENFWAVFAAGMTILGLEGYQVWTWCREEIRIQEEILAELERNRPKDDKPDDWPHHLK